VTDRRYLVVKGDNLWNIAKAQLGSGAQWPRIWRYNNRREVKKITGRGIPNPDLIQIGQILLIPDLPGAPPNRPSTGDEPSNLAGAEARSLVHERTVSPQAVHRDGPLQRQLPNLQSPISFKYRLDHSPPPIDTPTAVVEYRMTGDIILMTRKVYPATYVTSRKEIEVQVTQELNHAFGKLVQDNRFIYDPAQKQVTVRSMLVSASKDPHAPSTAVGIEMSSNSPIPKLRAEIRFPKLEGQVGDILYAAFDVKFVIMITPKLPLPRLHPIRIPQTREVREEGIDWSKIIGTGLIVMAGAIVVATIVEDFVTMGAGTADDPASFTAAAAALTRGLSLVRGVALPVAATPAVVHMRGSVWVEGPWEE
jgi:hypothetical protein